jgi:hypothetical protein
MLGKCVMVADTKCAGSCFLFMHGDSEHCGGIESGFSDSSWLNVGSLEKMAESYAAITASRSP